MPQKLDRVKRELWRKRLRNFERGNGTIVEFCRGLRVPVWSFYYWRQRLQTRPGTAASERRWNGKVTRIPHARLVHRDRRGERRPRLSFVPIQVAGERRIELHFPGGTRMTVPCHDREAIAAVIAALLQDAPEGRPC